MTEHDADLVAQLFQHPGWKILKARVNAEIDRREQAIVTVITRTDHPIDQQKVDRHRGLREGMTLFLREAEKAGRAFTRNQEAKAGERV